ncbi:MAG: SIMPL domain-containing protein [Anaerolineaceae bacterium]
MKNKYFLTGLIVLMMVLFTACSGTQSTLSNGSATQKSITVTGTGVVKVVPDIAYINVGISTQNENVTDAIEENSNQAQAIKDELISFGIPEADIQTSSFSVYPQSNYDNSGNITSTTFVVNNNVYVTVRDLNTMGELLGKVTTSGANSIYGISFDVQDKSAALTQSRELAVEFARQQAEEVAAASGVKLGEILTISVYSNDVPYIVSDSYGMGGGGYPQSATKIPISAGNYVISSNVTVQYVID